MSNSLETQRQGNALVIRFTRPEIRNPLSVEVLERLSEIVGAIPVDTGTLIFTGSDDVFASGADLREISAVTNREAKEFSLRGQALMALVAGVSQHTVAAINGYCFGGALDLALACDKRIASPAAKFAHPGAGLGIITGWGGTQRLPRLVGAANAFEMFFTAAPIDASRAMAIGLVDEIVADPLERALELSAKPI